MNWYYAIISRKKRYISCFMHNSSYQQYLFYKRKFMKSILVFSCVILLLAACKTTNNTNSQKEVLNLDWFYGLWKVTAFRFHDGRVMPGPYMGNPQYEFDKEGKRTKTLNEEPAPPPEVVDYLLGKDSMVSYPNNKFPAMKVIYLSSDSMVLSNDKLSWYLHK